MLRKIACYYTFKDCCILEGAVDEAKNLIIEKASYHQKLAVEALIAILNGYNCDRITNTNSAIAQSVNCSQYDFTVTDGQFETYSNYYEQLVEQGRWKTDGVKLRQGEVTNRAKQLLVMAFMKDLVVPTVDYSQTFAVEVRNWRPGWRRVF